MSSKQYIVRYHHTGPRKATSTSDAIELVRDEAVRVVGSAEARKSLFVVRADDGHYCYLTQADADADDSGASAFAVIESEEREEHLDGNRG